MVSKLNPINWIRALLNYLKNTFKRNGGVKGKNNWVILLIILYLLSLLRKHQGWRNKKKLEGKHVLITGAANGLGRYVAIRMAQRGAKVTILDVNEQGLEQTKRMTKSQCAKTKFADAIEENVKIVKYDLSDRQQVSKAAYLAESYFGPVDILINNANVIQGKKFLQMSEADASKTLVVNVESQFWLLKEVLPSMVERNSGHIVNIGSVFGQTGYAGMTDYCASKFASYGFHEALRMEMKQMKKRIAFTTVCPSFVNTGKYGGAQCGYIIMMFNQLWVADRILQAIVQEETEVTLPWWFGGVNHWSRIFGIQ